MQVGVIGCGQWGMNIVRNLSEMGCLKTVCDKAADRREFAQIQYPKVEAVGDYEIVLKDKGIDAVAVATNAASHHTIAKDALKAGKDVFVEKPMAIGVPDAKELVALAEEKKRILMTGHLLLYTEALKELKELMPELGDLLYVHAQRMGFSDPREDVSVIWDLAVHEVSALLYLLGTKPSRVKAYGHDFSANGVKDFVSLKMLFPGHVAAHVDITWWYPQKVRRMVVAGKKAMAIWDDQEAEYKLQMHKKWVEDGTKARLGRVSLISVPSCEPLRKELQHFIECCEKRKPPLTDGRNGLAVTEVLAAAERSLYRQEWQIV